ncbi:STAS domain-containing protein [Propionivibrio soli]|uniref:STAS domain-containing protein n=1 Tax=Propionivibrio soli TaxID=2976531 RepID=UPI0021E82C4D|nr:STAS domain-containing protein [Propionivibrio soli]
MRLEKRSIDDILVVQPIGRLDSTSSPELERVLVENLDAGTKRLLFDFSSLDYISSAGLRVVLLAGKRLRPVQGKMALVGMRDVVREVFEMSGFLSLFAVADTVEDGVTKV